MTGTTAGSTPRSPSKTTLAEPTISVPLAVPGHSSSTASATESILTGSSLASHDTFMTALTSSQTSGSPTISRLQTASPHSLRKSISVDSFIKNRRSSDLSEAGPSSGGHSREYSESAQSSAPNSIDLEDWNIRPKHTTMNGQHPPSSTNKSLASRLLGRTRGYSLSSNNSISDYDDPYLDDSDQERATDMAQLSFLSSHRSHSASSSTTTAFGKGKAKARLGDVLLLPPRAPALSNTSSASSINSLANGAAFNESVPPVPPIPHVHHRRHNVPGPLVMPRRTRSGSLNVKKSANLWATHDAIFSIAVVGAPGCGKTTIIRKGLRAWGVGEESLCTVATSKGRMKYGCRTINAPRDDAKTAHILELDSDALHLDSPNDAWPDELPRIDGVLVCYDVSNSVSFSRVPDLLACYHALHLPVIAVACKCDLEKKVQPLHASDRAAAYNVGLIEVTSMTDMGKRKMRNCFHWLIHAIGKLKHEIPAGSPYRNPASPDVFNAPPWSEAFGHSEARNGGGSRSRVGTPSGGSPTSAAKFREHPFTTALHRPASPTTGASTPTPRSPNIPTSPTRVKSTNDLISEVERSRQEMRRDSLDGRGGVPGRPASVGAESLHEVLMTNGMEDGAPVDGIGSGDLKDKPPEKNDEPPPVVWATLEELLDQLFYSAVSGEDPTLVKHFFLTYRRFATPRSILLGMQKRVRQLSQNSEEPFFGYAQMRICDLLGGWIRDYPTDFATPGASGAIIALVKQISSHLYTLHYGSDILPFLDEIPHLQDMDASWSIHEDAGRDSDEDDGTPLLEDEEEASREVVGPDTASSATTSSVSNETKSTQLSTRERKGSLPLSTRSSATPLSVTLSGSSDPTRSFPMSKRNSPKELVRLAQTLATYDALDIAQQITKMQSEMFLAIEPRQWLRYAMGGVRSTPGEPITTLANFYNQLANWVSSLILAHDRVKPRERQVERFIELAGKLRTLNNYVGLRAVKTGINNATYPNDEIMTLLRDNKLKQYQQFLGWEILLNSFHNHRAYRMAIKHTSGPGIPDMEVHTFDMVRAHDSNVDRKGDDPSKIHWGKFTLMARMIVSLQSLQDRIRSSGTYDFPERRWIREMINNDVMDVETMRSRVFPPPDDAEPILPVSRTSVDSPSAARTDAILKRLFFW